MDTSTPVIDDGTEAETVALSAVRSLEVYGRWESRVGTHVSCTSEQVGAFTGAIGIGLDENGNESGQYGWAALFAADRTGRFEVSEGDFVVRGSDDMDNVGTRVVFPGDVDGDGDGEFLTTAWTAYRPNPLVGAAFLYDASAPGTFAPEDARAHFLGSPDPDDTQSSLGGATRAGDLDGDGLAEIVLGHTYQGEPEIPGFVALHRGGDLTGEIPPPPRRPGSTRPIRRREPD